jgi:hypothetical protein
MKYTDFLFKPFSKQTTRFSKNKSYLTLVRKDLGSGDSKFSYETLDILTTDDKGKFIIPDKTQVLKYSKIFDLPVFNEDDNGKSSSNGIWKSFKGAGMNFKCGHAFATLKNGFNEVYTSIVRTDENGEPLVPEDVEVLFYFNFLALGN